MQIETHHEIALTKAVDTEIATLLEAAFGKDDGFEGRSFYKQRHHLRVLARENGQLIGHIALSYRVIRMGYALVPIIGLAEVATAPDQGGKGVASTLLHETIKIAAGTQAAFILLFGDHPIYERRGFVKVKNTMRFTRIEESRSQEVVTLLTEALQVMAVGDQTWDDTADIDLLGHLF
jgi:predicted N-acetyltransferase YhbS